MAHTSALKTAKYILKIAGERNLEITNLKLQKLLYYCQGWYLGLTGEPLFQERIEAWIRGPVVPPVYGEFKQFRWTPLALGTLDASIEEGNPRRPTKMHIEDVLDAYGNLTGPQLEGLTHKEDPWLDARRGLPADSPSNEIITTESMLHFFSARVSRI